MINNLKDFITTFVGNYEPNINITGIQGIDFEFIFASILLIMLIYISFKGIAKIIFDIFRR